MMIVWIVLYMSEGKTTYQCEHATFKTRKVPLSQGHTYLNKHKLSSSILAFVLLYHNPNPGPLVFNTHCSGNRCLLCQWNNFQVDKVPLENTWIHGSQNFWLIAGLMWQASAAWGNWGCSPCRYLFVSRSVVGYCWPRGQGAVWQFTFARQYVVSTNFFLLLSIDLSQATLSAEANLLVNINLSGAGGGVASIMAASSEASTALAVIEASPLLSPQCNVSSSGHFQAPLFTPSFNTCSRANSLIHRAYFLKQLLVKLSFNQYCFLYRTLARK